MYKKVHMEGELSVFHKQSSKRPGEMYNMCPPRGIGSIPTRICLGRSSDGHMNPQKTQLT